MCFIRRKSVVDFVEILVKTDKLLASDDVSVGATASDLANGGTRRENSD